MNVDHASMTLGTTHEGSTEVDETPADVPVETPLNIPASLGAVGYAAFALLQQVPLSELVPFPQVVAAFEAEALRQVPEPEPEPEVMAPVLTATAPPVPEPVVSYTVGGYRPEPGFQTWGRELPAKTKPPHPARQEVEARVDDSTLQEMAALGEPDRPSVEVEVIAVPVSEPFSLGGYDAKSVDRERQARQVLDELSFLFDGE